MDALELVINRRSQPRLQAPAPAGEALENIKRAALRAPDHAALAPWRFIICEGKGLNKLGAIFEQSAIDNDKSEREILRAPQLPLRAPMVIVITTAYQEHEKVPAPEQYASASCAAMAMQMAAVPQGFQGMWRTGDYAHCPIVKAGLDIDPKDDIVGFLYLGTPAQDVVDKPALDPAGFFRTLS
ncbi:NAD(P)H nitroreductase [Alteromonas lipolytica]|uniref:Putative NAD(P)H nitroreductase n=1 Tax=Alteromonas lipolytica TaxID=1856405 RepID=A0A1E8FIB8_9ALTE|nr:NAD(P)H nitroreductase [Alteromonas lipolytica]OFI35358.1 nitroreductase [Alteromonas lipolytica]